MYFFLRPLEAMDGRNRAPGTVHGVSQKKCTQSSRGSEKVFSVLILNFFEGGKNTGKIQLTIAGPLMRHIQATRQSP